MHNQGVSPLAHHRQLVRLYRTYADMAGPENAKKYQTLIFLAGSATAEVIADVALCPFEAVKVCLRDTVVEVCSACLCPLW